MSVILYEEQKFLKIYETLSRYQGNYQSNHGRFAQVFKYPEDYDKCLKSFVQDLHRSNILAWNRQYRDNQAELKVVSFRRNEKPYNNKCELLKSLESIRYNLADNGGNVTDICSCEDRLDKIINGIMSDIIEKIPEYEKADTWI